MRFFCKKASRLEVFLRTVLKMNEETGSAATVDEVTGFIEDIRREVPAYSQLLWKVLY